jgi:hypothetical protein
MPVCHAAPALTIYVPALTIQGSSCPQEARIPALAIQVPPCPWKAFYSLKLPRSSFSSHLPRDWQGLGISAWQPMNAPTRRLSLHILTVPPMKFPSYRAQNLTHSWSTTICPTGMLSSLWISLVMSSRPACASFRPPDTMILLTLTGCHPLQIRRASFPLEPYPPNTPYAQANLFSPQRLPSLMCPVHTIGWTQKGLGSTPTCIIGFPPPSLWGAASLVRAVSH